MRRRQNRYTYGSKRNPVWGEAASYSAYDSAYNRCVLQSILNEKRSLENNKSILALIETNVATLPKKSRAIVGLLCCGFKAREVAKLLGISRTWAAVLNKKAIERLNGMM